MVAVYMVRLAQTSSARVLMETVTPDIPRSVTHPLLLLLHTPVGLESHLSSTWFLFFWASLVAQRVKNPPAMQETWVRSLGCKDSLEKGMATHSSNPSRRIPWTEEPGGLQSMGLQRVIHD